MFNTLWHTPSKSIGTLDTILVCNNYQSIDPYHSWGGGWRVFCPIGCCRWQYNQLQRNALITWSVSSTKLIYSPNSPTNNQIVPAIYTSSCSYSTCWRDGSRGEEDTADYRRTCWASGMLWLIHSGWLGLRLYKTNITWMYSNVQNILWHAPQKVFELLSTKCYLIISLIFITLPRLTWFIRLLTHWQSLFIYWIWSIVITREVRKYE